MCVHLCVCVCVGEGMLSSCPEPDLDTEKIMEQRQTAIGLLALHFLNARLMYRVGRLSQTFGPKYLHKPMSLKGPNSNKAN